MKKWSKYQEAVFANIASGSGHTVVNAVAGSGKTTTIIESLKHVPKGERTLFVAFNKDIADNLKKKAPRGVEVSTLHSYGLKTVSNAIGRLTLNKDRVIHGFARELYGDHFELRRALSKVVSLAKGMLASEEDQIDAIIDDFSIEIPKPPPRVLGFKEPDTPEGQRALAAMEDHDVFCADVLKIMLRCANPLDEQDGDGQMDFDDMIWLPLVLELPQRRFDRVFVDETQDLNKAQIEMVMKAVKPTGRICAVGDPRQAIYGFRGADSAAVDNVIRRLDATVLPLSVCYRCARSIVEKAKEIVPQIESAPGADEGEVAYVTENEMIDGARAGDFILSRTNAPLISLCITFLREGIPANIQGRDVGAALSAFVKKSNSPNVPALRNYVEQWKEVECERLAKKHRDTQAVEDRAECILALSDGAHSVADVVGRIETLFADKNDRNRIILSTTHKAKGLERDRVWLLTWTYCRRPSKEENNLYYVAVTRAKKQLALVLRDNDDKKSR